MVQTDDCIFCKIVKGEFPCDKIFENENFLAFLDKNPAGEGHTLIIPKKHFNTFLDVDKKYSSEFMGFLQEVGEILLKKYEAEGFNVILNNGSAAGQEVNHVHFHILPRKDGDGKKGFYLG